MRIVALIVGLLAAFVAGPAPVLAQTPKDAQEIAAEAYVYGFPLVDNYRVMSAYFINRKSPEYKGPPNRIYTPPASIPRPTRPSRRPTPIPLTHSPGSIFEPSLSC